MSIDRACSELRAALANLDTERARIVSALELLDFATVAAPPIAAPPPLELHRCDQCEDAFATKQGLNMHRTRRHRPGSPTVAADPPKTPPADVDEIALRCEDCDFTAPVGPIRPLAAHVLAEHGRHELLVTERRPRRHGSA